LHIAEYVLDIDVGLLCLCFRLCYVIVAALLVYFGSCDLGALWNTMSW
jgi:hypothetical protein